MGEISNRSPRRAIISARVTDILGEPCQRPTSLGDFFCRQVLGRDLLLDIDIAGFDTIHVPSGFDSNRPVRKWFMYDLNVTGEILDPTSIPYEVYLARLSDGTW